MKRICILIIAVICGHSFLYAQFDNGLGYFTEEEIRERDAINRQVQSQYNLQNDRYYQTLTQYQYNPQLSHKVNNAINQAQHGIRIETSPYTYNTASNITSQQAQQIKRANRDAEHQAWLKQRQAAQEEAIEQARIKREQEEQRKKIEKQIRYNQVRASQYESSESRYNGLHSAVEYKATEGFDRMINYQPVGTEKIQSGYIPSSTKSNQDILKIISKSSNAPISLRLTGNETITYTDYEKEWIKCIKKIELPQRKESYYEKKNGEIWDEMRSKLDETQIQGIAYAMKSTNVRIIEIIDNLGNITTIKEGVLPPALGINAKGNYVFESAYDDRFDRVYEVSPNGVLTYVILDKHYFDDENVIKMIREGRFTDNLTNSFKNLIKVEGGVADLKDLREASPEKLRKLLPQIKAEFKMSLFDNSSTVKGKQVYFAPESQVINSIIKMKDATHSSYHVGYGGELSGGGKGEVKIGYGTNKWFTSPANTQEGETNEEKNHWQPDAKAGVTTAEAKMYAQAGRIKKVGNQFMQCTGTVQVKGSLEVDPKTFVKRNPLRHSETIGWSCKIITTSEDQFPTWKKR